MIRTRKRKQKGGFGKIRVAPVPRKPKSDLPIEVQKEIKLWQIVYPHYLDATKTVAEGRRLSKEKSVDRPSCAMIAQAATKLGFKAVVEKHKTYPRDTLTLTGRVRIQIKVEKEPVQPEIPNRRQLMVLIAKYISEHSAQTSQQQQQQPQQGGSSASNNTNKQRRTGKRGRRGRRGRRRR
mmetsp:Transcript_11539/g.17304  ORF Transcript_11539/g.17304 Transcript_11539/m.17304 type:complete len:180 (+) Transcript_11539:63-602(+)